MPDRLTSQQGKRLVNWGNALVIALFESCRPDQFKNFARKAFLLGD